MKTECISNLAAASSGDTARSSGTATLATLAFLLFISTSARAVDGCQVLLCLAAPNWRGISQCVPPVTQVLRDLARGKDFPTCNMSGPGNSASHAWSTAPTFCPPQYTHTFSTEGGPTYSCDYMGAITVTVDGAPFSRTWWTMDGSTSTDFSPSAKSQLKSWDSRFEDDYATWLNAQPPATGRNAQRLRLRIMEATAFIAVAIACAPQVHVATTSATVSVESSFNPWAIGVVGGALERQPRSRAEALATARTLRAGGWNFSVGLSQINVHSLVRRSLSLEKAFDPCANLAAMQSILLDCFKQARPPPSPQESTQVTLRRALSCYYSGDFVTGYRQGYVRRVVAASTRVEQPHPVAPRREKS